MKIKRISAALVIAVAICALIAIGGAQFSARGDDSYHNQLAGSWEVTVMPNGGGSIIDYATFHEGGGMTNIDPDPNLSAGIGSWERTGPNRFTVTFVHFLSDQGTPLGSVKVKGEMTYDSQTDTFSGPFRTDVVIGGNVVQSICGTVQFRRLSVEAVEECS